MMEEFIDDIVKTTDDPKTESEMITELQGPSTDKIVENKEKENDIDLKSLDGLPTLDKGKAKETDGNDADPIKELATQLGWREDHVGEDAVDARTYILRSKDIQKSMSQYNKDLKNQLQDLNGSVEALKQHNDKVYKAELKRLEGEVAALKKERKAAIELADVDKVEELDQQIEEKQKDINAPKPEDKQVGKSSSNPAYDEWIKDNDWYLKDDDMAKFADTIAQQYVGAPLERVYKIVRNKVQEVFPEKFEVSKPVNQDKAPIGPKSPVERSSVKGSGATFTKADLTSEQVQIMNQFVRGGIMTEEQYISDIAKMQ